MIDVPRREPTFKSWLVADDTEIVRATLPRARAVETWRRHRERFDATGLWPLIVPDLRLENLEEGFGQRDSTSADRIDVPAFFAERIAEWKPDGVVLDFDPLEMKPRKAPTLGWQVGALRENVKLSLVLVPCRAPWEIPLALGFGGWNDCPAPAEHAAVLQEWHRRYGAEPLVIGSDTLELLAAPIHDPQEAKRVATEQYAYAPDSWALAEDYVQVLATWLRSYSVWHFWWD